MDLINRWNTNFDLLINTFRFVLKVKFLTDLEQLFGSWFGNFKSWPWVMAHDSWDELKPQENRIVNFWLKLYEEILNCSKLWSTILVRSTVQTNDEKIALKSSLKLSEVKNFAQYNLCAKSVSFNSNPHRYNIIYVAAVNVNQH